MTLEVNFVIIYLYEIEIISYLKVILTPHFYIQKSVQSYGRLRDYFMAIPDYRIDYTETALEVYEMAMWKGYKFLKGRNLDSWLQYAWSILFRRKMNEHDLRVLQHFIKQKKSVDLKIKCNERLNHKERNFTTQYIGKDGYVYMNKMMISGEVVNPNETARLEKLLQQTEKDRLARYEEYEIRHLNEMARRQWFNNQDFKYKGIPLKWK